MKETRRNLIVNNVDLGKLVGIEFMVGSVRMRGVEICTPCKWPEKLVHKRGFEQAFGDDRGGIRAEILTSGWIAVGDHISVRA